MEKFKRQAMADAVQIIYWRYYEGRPEHVKGLGEARVTTAWRGS